MPLRFRSVVPYTLPGVLALIGWWWYISRKKERTIMGHDATEETPPTVGHLTSPTVGSNGLVEKGTTVSPTIDTTTRDTTTRDTPPHVKEQRSTEQDVTAQVHIQATKTSPTTTQDQCFDREVLLNDKVRAGLGNHTDNTADSSRLPPSIEEEPRSCRRVPDKDRLEDLLDQGALPTLATQREKDVVQEPVVSALECRAEAAFSSHRSPPQVIHNTHTAATGLTNAARPEPEGEIATQEVTVRCAAQPIKDVHATIATTKDENIFSPAATLAKKAPEESSPTSMQSSYHHVLTSTPISLTPATASAAAQVVPVQDSSTRGGLASEDSLVVSQRGQQEEEGSGARSEEQELEHLAAGLITEVISAATQEVLGAVARCRGDVTDGSSQPPGCINNSTTLLANGGGLCSQQQQPIITRETAAEQHSLLQGGGPSPIGGPGDSRESQWEEGEQGLPNGCASALVWEPSSAEVCRDHGDNNEEDNVQSSYSPVVSSSHHQAAAQQGGATTTLPVLSRLKEGLAEDSACSTSFHSSEVDGVSNRNLQTGVPENRVVDLIRGVKDMSEQPPSLLLPQLSAAAEADASEAAAAAAVVALTTEEEEEEEEEHGGIDAAVCEMKRLNRVGLRNGAHGAPSETETDQSGGSDVNSMDSVDSGCTMGAGDSLSSQTTGQGSEVIIWDIEVPKHLVGRLIGKQGRYVSFLKQNSGAKIYISTLPYTQEFQICHIEGTQQQVDKALSLIGKKFKDLDLTNLYAPPPPPLTLPSLPMTSWLMLPSGVTVEVIVVNIVSAGHVFVQQHTHPTYHALRSLDQQMLFCYSQPGTPALPSPAVGVICAAPALEGAWWRAQVITFYKETNEVEIRYVDYGGYDRVKIDTLRQIRSDFVTLPFQGAEVLLDNIAPLPGEDRFSTEASTALEEMTRGVPLLAQVSNYDNNTGLPLVQLWNMVGEEVILLNRTLAERGFGTWVDSF